MRRRSATGSRGSLTVRSWHSTNGTEHPDHGRPQRSQRRSFFVDAAFHKPGRVVLDPCGRRSVEAVQHPEREAVVALGVGEHAEAAQLAAGDDGVLVLAQRLLDALHGLAVPLGLRADGGPGDLGERSAAACRPCARCGSRRRGGRPAGRDPARASTRFASLRSALATCRGSSFVAARRGPLAQRRIGHEPVEIVAQPGVVGAVEGRERGGGALRLDAREVPGRDRRRRRRAAGRRAGRGGRRRSARAAPRRHGRRRGRGPAAAVRSTSGSVRSRSSRRR